MQDNKK